MQANYAPRMGGRVPPKPPLMTQRAGYTPRMGGGSPQTPLMTQGATNTPKEAISHSKTPKSSNFRLFLGQALNDWAGSRDKCS